MKLLWNEKVRLKLILFVFLLIFFISCKNVYADSGFKTSYDATYQINSNGITHVTLKGQMINETSDHFISSYLLNLGFANIKNLKVDDGAGVIRASLKSVNSQTQISFPFNEQVVGKGKILYFTISFDTNDLASNLGKIWEINLPAFKNQLSFQDFNVHIFAPYSFGIPSVIKPNINLKNGLNFTKQDLGNSGISIIFGKFQSFNFKLFYNLYNPNLFPIKTEIAIPMNTNYQNIEINEISPKPINVKMDKDGNWLAQYSLLGNQKETIMVKGNALLYLNPKSQALILRGLQTDLKPQPYWETNNLEIKNLAQKLKTPEAIFQFVVSHLSYDYQRANNLTSERFGALNILNNPTQAVCLEFSDLFIALSRAAGIPAREIEGYAYTQNSVQRPLSLIRDVLHAWPEYYSWNKKTWIMVDPTWENTTGGTDYFNSLDLDHLAFVINGASSVYPIPAGGYKFSNSNAKDVFISFSNNQFRPNPKIKINLSLSSFLNFNKSQTLNLEITNIGKVALPASNITINSKNLVFSTPSFLSDSVPPYGKVIYELKINKLNFLTGYKSLVKIQIGNLNWQKEIIIFPFFGENKIYLIGGILIVGIFTIIIFKITRKAWRLFFSK